VLVGGYCPAGGHGQVGMTMLGAGTMVKVGAGSLKVKVKPAALTVMVPAEAQ